MSVRKKSPIELAGGQRASIYWIDVDQLQIAPNFNVRVDYGDIEALARSIASEGVREPLRGYFDAEDRAVITDGHRRLRAIALARKEFDADIKRVLFQLEPRYHNEGDRFLTMLVSNSGKNLSPYEIGLVVQRLLKFGWQLQEIHERAGYSKKYLERCQILAAATPELKSLMLRDKSVSQTTVMKAIERHGMDEAAPLLQEAVAQAKEQGKQKASGVMVADVAQQLADGRELDAAAIEPETAPVENDPQAGEVSEQQRGKATGRKAAKPPVEVSEAEREQALGRIETADWAQMEGVDLLRVLRLLDRKQIPQKC